MNRWKWITLRAPAVCRNCDRILRRGTGCFWEPGGAVMCYKCMKKVSGEYKPTKEEREDMADLDNFGRS